MEKSGNFYIEEAESDFKKVHKSIIQDKDIDCLTLGIYVKILVLGKTWQLNIKGLSSYFGLSDMKIRRSISLLEKKGYIARKPIQDESTGKMSGWVYIVYAKPLKQEERTCAGLKTDYPENRQHGSPTTRFPDNTETGGLLNNRLKEDIDLREYNRHKEQKEEKDKSFSKKTYDLSFVDGKYMSTFTEWLEYKAERKEKYKTVSSLKACYNRLLKLSGDNPQIAAEIVQQSIANNYAGLFEYKEMRTQKPKPKTQEEINREKLNMPILNDDGDLPDGTFFKNGKRWYFSKQEGRAASCAPDASPRPNDRAEYDWAIKDWRVPRDKWEASDEIW